VNWKHGWRMGARREKTEEFEAKHF